MVGTLILLLSLGLLAVACADNEEAPLVSSGIEGQVFAGPQCPVMREGTPCPDHPLQATILVWSSDRIEMVTSFTSDEEGRFRITLAPGEYHLDPQRTAPDNPFPVALPQSITVEDDRWAQVTIQYDTGIR